MQDRIKEVLDLHLRSDVPVGLLLSGGIDSSTLAAYLSEEVAQKTSAFTLNFDKGNDENKNTDNSQ